MSFIRNSAKICYLWHKDVLFPLRWGKLTHSLHLANLKRDLLDQILPRCICASYNLSEEVESVSHEIYIYEYRHMWNHIQIQEAVNQTRKYTLIYTFKSHVSNTKQKEMEILKLKELWQKSNDSNTVWNRPNRNSSSRTNCQPSLFIKTSLKGSGKGSFSWDNKLQTNGCSIMTTPNVALPSTLQNFSPQKDSCC